MRLLKQFQPLWFVALFLPNWQKSNIKICPCQYSVKSILWFSRLLALKELWTYFSWLCNFWINFPSMGKILRSFCSIHYLPTGCYCCIHVLKRASHKSLRWLFDWQIQSRVQWTKYELFFHKYPKIKGAQTRQRKKGWSLLSHNI